jgi:hypothetical protein
LRYERQEVRLLKEVRRNLLRYLARDMVFRGSDVFVTFDSIIDPKKGLIY